MYPSLTTSPLGVGSQKQHKVSQQKQNTMNLDISFSPSNPKKVLYYGSMNSISNSQPTQNQVLINLRAEFISAIIGDKKKLNFSFYSENRLNICFCRYKYNII